MPQWCFCIQRDLKLWPRCVGQGQVGNLDPISADQGSPAVLELCWPPKDFAVASWDWLWKKRISPVSSLKGSLTPAGGGQGVTLRSGIGEFHWTIYGHDRRDNLHACNLGRGSLTGTIRKGKILACHGSALKTLPRQTFPILLVNCPYSFLYSVPQNNYSWSPTKWNSCSCSLGDLGEHLARLFSKAGPPQIRGDIAGTGQYSKWKHIMACWN